MKYTFELLGVSPVLYFFSHYQLDQNPQVGKPEYIGTHQGTLDEVLYSMEPLPKKRGWDLDEIVDSVIEYWVNNGETVQRWQTRLKDAGKESLLVARISDVKSLRAEFEALLQEDESR